MTYKPNKLTAEIEAETNYNYRKVIKRTKPKYHNKHRIKLNKQQTSKQYIVKQIKTFKQDYNKKSKESKLRQLKYYASLHFNARGDYKELRRKKHFPHYKACFVCTHKIAYCYHHIMLLINGGTNHKYNRIPICNDCHANIHTWLANKPNKTNKPFKRISACKTAEITCKKNKLSVIVIKPDHNDYNKTVLTSGNNGRDNDPKTCPPHLEYINTIQGYKQVETFGL